ncbi:hypothetical protein CUJ91_29425 [Paraburkholderia graminis]|jgi:hypothetical protein|uniref:hypothetical protein n=1 Tax=Paraburkholderia graminis TaxID=60548 RepID=UPI000DEF5B7A|nr:hypothetical protein [Paraburkholderia graminis]AXF11930.1 hypothetical protein CUJ91_29425 [Paraburkholderia graminis]MDR6471010.1 hypothetical protein [Paraburkholderia graminis]
MKSHLVFAMLTLAAVTGANALAAAPPASVWAGEPGGVSATSSVSAPALLQWSGAIPLSTAGGEKCLLVARRQSHIVAIELSPLVVGPGVIGWAPNGIGTSTASSEQANAATARDGNPPRFSNPATAAITASNHAMPRQSVTPETFSKSGSWRNSSVEADRKAAAAKESVEVVTVKGKTYRTYGHFKTAPKEVPTAVSEEKVCQ